MQKKFNYFGDVLRNLFKEKVYKISIDANFTCPNRDGTKAFNGCIYCNEQGSASLGVDKKLSIKEQILEGKKHLYKKYKAKKFLAYFQPFSNTYASVDYLRKIYYEALEDKDIVGISISTRSDTLNEEKLDLIQELSNKIYTWLEIGLQSIHNKTLKFINRHDTFENFLDIYKKAKDRQILVCVHIILGLPFETEENMLQTIDKLIELKVDGIKFHVLHVLKNTVLEKLYLDNKIKLLEEDEYINLIVTILKRLPKDIIIHRITSEGPSKDVIAPKWILNKRKLIEKINNLL